MKTRRHHNTTGRRQAQTGEFCPKPQVQITSLAEALGQLREFVSWIKAQPSGREPATLDETLAEFLATVPSHAVTTRAIDESALNEAGWTFVENMVPGGLTGHGFNNVKSALRAAVKHYIAAIASKPPGSGDDVTETHAWQAMVYAPRDGSKIELLVEHREYWIALKNNRADGYRQECVGSWTDFNGGGWSWMGTAGQPIGWRPLQTDPSPTSGV